MTRDPEAWAAEIIADAEGRFDQVQPLVRQYAALSVEVDRLHERIFALPVGDPAILPLAIEATTAFNESTEILAMLLGPGRPLPQ